MKTLVEWLDAERGRRVRLAASLGINPSSIHEWESRDNIPAERIVEVERFTGIPRDQLRPDLYLPLVQQMETRDAS